MVIIIRIFIWLVYWIFIFVYSCIDIWICLIMIYVLCLFIQYFLNYLYICYKLIDNNKFRYDYDYYYDMEVK